MNVHLRPLTTYTETDSWREWTPGLDNDEHTLRAVYEKLPVAEPEEIKQMVRLLEHPASPYTGGSLDRLRSHDCLHIILGRGLLNQDEAFVIGYVMGTFRDHLKEERVQQFRQAAKLLFKPPYRMTEADLTAFDLAFELAKQSGHRNIHEFDFAGAMELDLGDIRAEAGVNSKALKAVFREERLLLPGNKASERLPII